MDNTWDNIRDLLLSWHGNDNIRLLQGRSPVCDNWRSN